MPPLPLAHEAFRYALWLRRRYPHGDERVTIGIRKRDHCFGFGHFPCVCRVGALVQPTLHLEFRSVFADFRSNPNSLS